VCFLIQPIVMVHTAQSNTGKPSEKSGYTSSEFDELFLFSVGEEKGKEVIVETSGLLTHMLPIAGLMGSRIVTNSFVELTEDIENQPVSKILTTSSTEKEQTIQQDQLPDIIEGELSQLLQNNPRINNLTELVEIPYQDIVKTDDFHSHTVENKSMNHLPPLDLGQVSKLGEQTNGFQVIDKTSPESESLLQVEELKNLTSKGSNESSVLKVKVSRDDTSDRQINAKPKDPSSILPELRDSSKEFIGDSKGSRYTNSDISQLQESRSFSSNVSPESSLSLNVSNNQILNKQGSRMPKYQISPLPIKEFGRQEMKKDLNFNSSTYTEVQPLIQENELELESSVVFKTTQNDVSNGKSREGIQAQSGLILQTNDLHMDSDKKPIEFSIPMNISKGNVLDGEISEETNRSSHNLDNRNDFGRNEMAENFLIADKTTGDNHTIMNPILNQNDTTSMVLPDSFEKNALPNTLSAVQFEKEIDMFVKSAFQVQDLSDGMEASFRLSPEHMGKVDVKVSIIDGNVTAEFLTSTTAGKDLLEAHVQTLRMALETQGFQVDKINVSQQNASTFLGSFSQKGESNGRHSQQDAKKRNVQIVQNQEKEYQEYGVGSGSQINTTA
jgi:flagellar hook-length control protein FliK